jgi:hypothetical protein
MIIATTAELAVLNLSNLSAVTGSTECKRRDAIALGVAMMTASKYFFSPLAKVSCHCDEFAAVESLVSLDGDAGDWRVRD